jgi:peptidoglycan/xylan/chitin deacetylase (PgdA/CDA1 family)
MDNMTIVTTSWDDGCPVDLKLAELLLQHNLPGTFYCPLQGENGRPTLSAEGLRSLHSAGFEIGGHSVTHPVLTAIPLAQARVEIFRCKSELENLLGTHIRMFCYPRGRSNASTIRFVKEAGYRGARGTQLLSTDITFAPFLMPTSVQAVPHRLVNYLRNLARCKAWRSLYHYLYDLRRYDDWVALAKRLFDDAVKSGGVWHLWGHSWEIEEMGLWNELECLFDYVGGRSGVLYASNCSTIDIVESLGLGTEGKKAA